MENQNLEQELRKLEGLILELSGSKVKKALEISLSRTLKTLSLQTLRETKNKTRVPISILKQRTKIFKKKGIEKPEQVLSIIANDVPAVLLGAVQNRFGVRTRAGSIRGAFVAKSKFSRLSRLVYKRVSNEQYPLEQQTVEISEAVEKSIRNAQRGAEKLFFRNFENQIKRYSGLFD